MTRDALEQLIEPLREAPEVSALLFDVDGTLAPIVEDPAEASVPAPTRDGAPRVGGALRARRMRVGTPRARSPAPGRGRGADLCRKPRPRGARPRRAGGQSSTNRWAIEHTRRGSSRWISTPRALSEAGLRLEDKGPIQALHWRGSPDEPAAERRAREIAERAERAGLEPRWGRKVLELRPITEVDKGTAVRRLLASARRAARPVRRGRPDRSRRDPRDPLTGGPRGSARSGVHRNRVRRRRPPGSPTEVDALVSSPAELVEVLGMLASADAAEGASG